MQFAVIGNPTIDLIKGRERIGGSVIYTSLTIARLGHAVTIFGNRGADLEFTTDEVEVRLRECGNTTKFRFGREFRIEEKSEEISVEDLRDLEGRVIHCAPVFREIGLELLDYLREKAAFLSVDAHGFLRKEEKGRVFLERPDRKIKADFIKVNEEEAGYLDAEAGVLAITRGEKGARIIAEKEYDIPSFPVKVVDCIGAGDVFCGAFLVRYLETKDAYEAGVFASGAASLSCQGRGIASIPTRKRVIERIS
jgi:sugar/nucleoside kinase (ribokinase family)